MSNEVSIVVLNWDGKAITEECLKSIEDQSYQDYEVIVVDNASTDDSVPYLRKKFPKFTYLINTNNLGYAGGNNTGIKNAKGSYILILNNDIVLDKHFLKELVLNKNKADILGVKNYYYDRKDILWAVGVKINPLTLVAILVGKKEKDIGQYDNYNPHQIVGSSMFVKREVFNKIGYFDEKFFCYVEETEWQTRALNAGFETALVPTAKLWHRVAYSTGGGDSPLSAYYLVRNRAYYIERWAKFKILAYLVWVAEVTLRFSRGIIKGNWNYSKASLRGFKDYILDKSGATFES